MYQLGQSTYELAPVVFDLAPRRGGCGLGCADCGGKCHGGMGVFDSGFSDWNSWGWQEWAIVLFGAYALGSMIFTTKRGVKAVAAMPGERRKRRAKRLRAEASELTKKRK